MKNEREFDKPRRGEKSCSSMLLKVIMYSQVKAHVPKNFHHYIKNAITRDKPLAVKLDLTRDGDDIILLTSGQLVKIHKALLEGKKSITFYLGKEQVKANTKFEGGFLSILMRLATETLPTLLSDLTTGVTLSEIERAAAENGLFLGRQGWGTVRVELNGDGIGLTPVHSENICGLYFKHDG